MVGIDVKGGACEHDLQNGCIFLVKHQTRLPAESEDGGMGFGVSQKTRENKTRRICAASKSVIQSATKCFSQLSIQVFSKYLEGAIMYLENHLFSMVKQSLGLRGDQPKYSLEGLMLKLKLQNFGHLMRRADSLEKTLSWERCEGSRRG